jgi:hypothetical protein
MAHGKRTPGGGPGTYVAGGVRCTINPPFKSAGKGPQQTMKAPFNQGRTGGDNGCMPERIYDDLGGPAAAPKATSRDALGTIKTSPTSSRR